MATGTQYATDDNLRARQNLWAVSPRRPAFSLHSWVIGLARLTAGEQVLDLGCGNGKYLDLLGDAVGLDASPGMLAAARARMHTATPLVAGDALALPFRDGSFDVVIAAHMLYHVPDREKGAAEMRRVLADGGTCIAVTNGEAAHRELVELVEDVVGHGWRWGRPSSVDFSLENGAAQLRSAFPEVVRVDCPTLVVDVTDADALAGYVMSVADHYGPEVAAWTTWTDVVEECRRRASGVIATEGSFRISTSVGAFVCR